MTRSLPKPPATDETPTGAPLMLKLSPPPASRTLIVDPLRSQVTVNALVSWQPVRRSNLKMSRSLRFLIW